MIRAHYRALLRRVALLSGVDATLLQRMLHCCLRAAVDDAERYFSMLLLPLRVTRPDAFLQARAILMLFIDFRRCCHAAPLPLRHYVAAARCHMPLIMPSLLPLPIR